MVMWLLPFSGWFLAQATGLPDPPPPLEWVRPQEVRPLPGRLDRVPVFNSNSPELIVNSGILLSTFPPDDRADPKAHLNFPLTGKFDIFAHHVARVEQREMLGDVYLGLILQNAQDDRAVTVNVLGGSSYRSQPDAPFITLPDWVEDPAGLVFAGPGSRAMSHLLRELPLQADIPPTLVLQPGETQVLLAMPILSQDESPLTNGRSVLLELESNGPVYIASLGYFAPPRDLETQAASPPDLDTWLNLLNQGQLGEPRDRIPTPLDQTTGAVIYSRVAGVAEGADWYGWLVDDEHNTLAIPEPGKALSYPVSTLHRGRMGTDQVQSGELLVRYDDTAYQSHGNYGVGYRLTLPLENQSDRPQSVAISLETPLKEDYLSEPGLRFFVDPPNRIFFRGPVRIRYRDENDRLITRYIHLVMRRGQRGEPLATLPMAPGEIQQINVDLLYPPDSTPPQVLTIETLPRQAPPPLPEPEPEPEPEPTVDPLGPPPTPLP